jgi:biopolymer transport protein ExbD
MAETPVAMPEKRFTDRARSRSYAARYQRRRPGSIMNLNLTSMIDVVFLLLFFFLAASRFSAPEGTLPADLPKKGAAVAGIEIPRTPIQIRMSPDPESPSACRLTVDRFHPAPLPVSELAVALQKIRNEVPGYDGQTPVHLVADDRVSWDVVVSAYNAALFARFEKIYFVGSKP